MYDRILKRLAAFILLDKSEEEHFISKLQVREFDKKQIILREGEVCKYAYFINYGCLRYYYNVEGQENTAQFFFENGWYADYESFLSGKPSKQNIETLEKSELLLLSSRDLQQLYIDLPKFERFGRLMAENAFLGIRHRSEMLEKPNGRRTLPYHVKGKAKSFSKDTSTLYRLLLGDKTTFTKPHPQKNEQQEIATLT